MLKEIGFVLLFTAVLSADAYFVKGHRKSSDEFTLVGRFCFDTVPVSSSNKYGIYIHETSEKFSAGSTNWAIYYDAASSWYSNYKTSRTCHEKFVNATKTFQIERSGSHTLHPNNHARARIWYVVLLNCPLKNETHARPYDIKYNITFLNVDGSHIGYDEVGILPLNAVYFVFFFILMCVHLVSAYFLWLKKSLHPIVSILAICIILMTVSTMFVLIHWAQYKSNGVGCPGCRTFGQLVCGFASILFAMLLIMIASGWAITFHALQRRFVLLGIFIAYVFFFLLFFIISTSTATSTASTQIVYSHGAMLVFVVFYILVCWLGVFGYFAFSLTKTFQEETQYDKRLFYLIFGIGYGMWFVLPALFNFISMGVDEWFRPRVVDAFQLTASFIGMTALVGLLWPSRVEKYFRIISPDILSSDTGAI